MSFSRKLLSFTGLFALGVSAAFAQGVPQSIVDCASQKRDAARLACFDREVAKLTQPEKSVAPTHASRAQSMPTAVSVAATPQPSARTQEDEFGVSGDLARKRTAAQKSTEAPLQELHATVASVKQKPYGELVMELDNGQVWEQPERKLTFLIKEGERITIKQHKLGSFFLTTDSGATSRVRRVR
jgi:hypothetical protein